MNKTYIGDGVYARFTQYGELVLTTMRDDLNEFGEETESVIFLEPQVWAALVAFRERAINELTKARNE